MADLNFEGIEELNAKLKKLNKQASRIENKALREAAKIIHEEIVERAPKSTVPRLPGKNGSQKWRTGRHAAEFLKVGNVVNKNGNKSIKIGLTRGDNSKAFYLKFFEWGTSKMEADPFMDPAAIEKKEEAKQKMADILREGLGL